MRCVNGVAGRGRRWIFRCRVDFIVNTEAATALLGGVRPRPSAPLLASGCKCGAEIAASAGREEMRLQLKAGARAAVKRKKN